MTLKCKYSVLMTKIQADIFVHKFIRNLLSTHIVQESYFLEFLCKCCEKKSETFTDLNSTLIKSFVHWLVVV